MLAEFVNKIAQLSTCGLGAELLKDPADPRRAWIVQNGEREEISLRRPCVHPAFSTLAGFADGVANNGCAVAEVFVSPGAVRAELDGRERKDSATLPLAATDRFFRATRLATAPSHLTPRETWRLLVHDFQGCDVPANIIDALTNVKFQTNRQSGGAAGHGVDQMGASVNQAVENSSEIPKSFTLMVPVYNTEGLEDIKAKLTFSVEADFDHEKIIIGVYRDSLRTAINAAIRAVRNRVDDEIAKATTAFTIPVYAGGADLDDLLDVPK